MSTNIAAKKLLQIRPDAKGRITLGKLAKGISSFFVSKEADGKIILEPMVEIPANEKWLFENKTALSSLKRGLEDSAKNKVVSRGSFIKYTEEDK